MLLFGKPFGALTCRDVREKLATVHESSSIEFKETFESEKELKEAILKNVVAFLNTSEGRGLLILGIKDVRKERYEKKITGVPKDLVGGRTSGEVEGYIREIVFSKLKSIPPFVAPPRLDVKVFDCKSDCELSRDGWLILVYVERKADALYYSEIDGNAYIREGSSTRKLSLMEVVQLIESKRKPMLVLLLEPRLEDLGRLKCEVVLWNIGHKLASKVAGKLLICKSIGPNIVIKSVRIGGWLSASPIQEIDQGFVMDFTVASPFRTPIFPGVRVTKGELEMILSNDFSDGALLNFYALIFTEETKTNEKCAIELCRNSKSKSVMSLRVEDYIGTTLLERENWSP
jgi:hypothetical protein